MCDNNGDAFIVTLYNVLLAPDLCDGLFSIIMLANLGQTCLFKKKCMVYYGDKEKMWLPCQVVHKETCILWGNKTNFKNK